MLFFSPCETALNYHVCSHSPPRLPQNMRLAPQRPLLFPNFQHSACCNRRQSNPDIPASGVCVTGIFSIRKGKQIFPGTANFLDPLRIRSKLTISLSNYLNRNALIALGLCFLWSVISFKYPAVYLYAAK